MNDKWMKFVTERTFFFLLSFAVFFFSQKYIRTMAFFYVEGKGNWKESGKKDDTMAFMVFFKLV